MKKILIGVVLAGVLFSYAKADTTSDAVAKAVAYLKTQGNEATKTMALVATGETVDVSYLKSFTGTTAIEYAKPIMAIVAAGENPSTYPAQDFVAKLKSFTDSTQLGSASQVNDDIWGILALSAAGVQSSDSVIQNSKAFILANQNADGGWAWNTGGTSDTNDTAVAIMVLLETGIARSEGAIQKAIAYLKGAQNTDGGFPYDPVSPFGTDSDGNSDAWVIMAINKLGENSTSWTKNGPPAGEASNNPVGHLLSLQDSDGGFWWMQPPADFNNKGATADAVIALSGKSFPVASSGGGNSSDSTVFYRIVGSSGEICKGGVKAATAMEVVVLAASDCAYTYEIKDFSFGKFLSRINNDASEGLKGWLYRVDGVLPNVGAADFALSGGEYVLWYYGESDDPPPALGDVSDSVDLAVEIVPSGSGGGGTPDIAFTVSSSSVNFGKLVPGSSAMGQVTLKNEGQKNLNLQAEITGNAVFNFLKIESVIWNLFETLLSAGAQKNVGLQLSLPSGFNSFGQRQGTLIFWGTAQ
ncbi:MAG TPA: DUF4430 domain-containing protein [Candidatus Paceibacterota bacterium]